MPSQTRGAVPMRGVLVLALLVPVAGLLSLAIGANPTAPAELWHALVAPSGQEADVVVRELRLPRTLLGLVVGSCLGAAGVLMQGHTRNPLAEPGLLGVSAGAAFFVVLGLRFGLVESLRGTVYAAALGALAASGVVVALARRGTRGGGASLVVAGAALTALLGALTSGIVLLDAQTLDSYRFWAVGSLAGRGPDTWVTILPFALAGLVLAACNARALDVLALGDDMAATMGVPVTRVRVLGLAAVTLLTAAAVAACGPVAFVGLVAGHLARAVVGARWTLALVSGCLTGAVLLVGSDILGRLVGGPGELQVGVVAGLVGAPLLVWVVRRGALVL